MQTFKPTAVCAALVMSLVAFGAMAAPASRYAWSSQGNERAIQATVIYSFTGLDLNRDGELSRSEVPLDMVDLRMDFRRADYTGNGRLSPAECAMYAHGKIPQYTGVGHAWNVVLDDPDPKDRIIADR